MTVIPAYGRDYMSATAARQDWEDNKDFLIQDVGSRWNGSYINKSDAIKGNVPDVLIRYCKLTKAITVKVDTTNE